MSIRIHKSLGINPTICCRKNHEHLSMTILMTAMKISRWRVGGGVHKTTDCGDQVTTGHWVTPHIIMVSDCLQIGAVVGGRDGDCSRFLLEPAALFEEIILYNYFFDTKIFFLSLMHAKASPTVYCLKRSFSTNKIETI